MYEENSLALSPSPTPLKTNNNSTESDKIEQKIWEIVKEIPGINVGYGTIRLVIYISKGNKEESWKSVAGVGKGIVQSAAIAGSIFVAPMLAPIAAGAFSGLVTDSIKGAAHVIIFVIDHPDKFLEKKTTDSKEKLVYDEVKDIPAIGPAYSIARAPIYSMKGNNQEAKISGTNAISGSANTLVNCGIAALTCLDAETKDAVKSISSSLIQLLSRKVIDEVSKEKLSLEEGISIVEAVEGKLEELETTTETESNHQDETENIVAEEEPSNEEKEDSKMEIEISKENAAKTRNSLMKLMEMLKFHKSLNKKLSKKEGKKTTNDQDENVHNNSLLENKLNPVAEVEDSNTPETSDNNDSIVIII